MKTIWATIIIPLALMFTTNGLALSSQQWKNPVKVLLKEGKL